MSRFTYDTEQLAGGITLLGGRLIREPLKCLACAVLALVINWRLTLLSLFFVPILAAFFLRFGQTLKRASKKMMESMSRIYKVLEETFEARKIVIAFGSSRRHREQFQNEYQRYFDKALQVVRTDALAKPSMEMLGLVALFVAMLPGAYLVIRAKTSIYGIRLAADVMDAAQLGTLYAMLAGMLDPCRKLSTTYSRIKRSAAAADRVFALMDMKPKVREIENAAPLRAAQGVDRVSRCQIPLSRQQCIARTARSTQPDQSEDRGAASRRDRRSQRLREVDAPQPDSTLLRPHRRGIANRRHADPTGRAG